MRWLRHRWVPTLATLALLPLLVALGFWQLNRAEQKRALQAEYDARAKDAPVQIEGRLQQAELLRFRRVIATGRYEPQHQILLDNRVHLGRPGYFVLTPLRIHGSDVRVLVNRGWVALGESREQLPMILTPAGEQRIRGLAAVPLTQGFHLGPAVAPSQAGWQAVWQYLDLDYYRQLVSYPVQPVVVLLDPQESGGFVREWKRLDTGIAVHQGYAFQWFSLAVALLAIYLFLQTRGTKEHEAGSE